MRKRQNAELRKPEMTESLEDLQQKVRQRAYELYELRGREEGHDWDDWLKAESEVIGKAVRNELSQPIVALNTVRRGR